MSLKIRKKLVKTFARPVFLTWTLKEKNRNKLLKCGIRNDYKKLADQTKLQNSLVLHTINKEKYCRGFVKCDLSG